MISKEVYKDIELFYTSKNIYSELLKLVQYGTPITIKVLSFYMPNKIR